MAQPFKQGVEYYTVDIDIDEDNRVISLDHRFREAYKFLNFMWKFIYSNGYFVHWNEGEYIKFCNKTGFSPEKVNAMVDYSMEIGLFSRDLFDKYGIITSQSVQRRWLIMCRRRKHIAINSKFLLIPSDIFKKLQTAAISIEKSVDSKFKPFVAFDFSDVEEAVVEMFPEDMGEKPEGIQKPAIAPKPEPTVQPAAAQKKKYGTFNYEELKAFVSVPYSERNEEFKKLHTEQWYNSYLKFNSDIDKDHINLRNSHYQITIVEYKNILSDPTIKWTPSLIKDILTRLSSAPGNEDADMDKRFIQFIQNPNEKSKPKPNQTTATTFYTGPQRDAS